MSCQHGSFMHVVFGGIAKAAMAPQASEPVTKDILVWVKVVG